MPTEKLKKMLETLGYPVNRIYYEGEADTYLTFRMLGATPNFYSDDDYERLTFDFSVVLTTKKDYTALLPKIIQLLRNEEYVISGIEAEVLNVDTGFFYVPITIKIVE